MKNILARGGIEFLAVLLGISGSLWIENNKEEAELQLEKGKVFILIQKEGKKILDNSGLKLISAEDLDDAAKKIVEVIK